jgi:hypothetical protein
MFSLYACLLKHEHENSNRLITNFEAFSRVLKMILLWNPIIRSLHILILFSLTGMHKQNILGSLMASLICLSDKANVRIYMCTTFPFNVPEM